MGVTFDERRMQLFLDAVYDAAVMPDRWPDVLARLAEAFDGSFVDIFTRSQDRRFFSGLAHGLDRADYEDEFLGVWLNRNVWGNNKPVEAAGEVMSTRSMVDMPQLLRSDIYNDYLEPRGLHEGLRLSLFADADHIQDISILRPWSQGAFGRAEIARGHLLLPHLQRAAAVTRRLQMSEISFEGGTATIEAGRLAIVTFDRSGVPVLVNRAAERLLAATPGLGLSRRGFTGPSPEITGALQRALGRATGQAGGPRRASLVTLPGAPSLRALHIMAVPLSMRATWAMPRPPVAMAMLRDHHTMAPSAARLITLFGLTRAEADVGQRLATGEDVKEVAAATGRSLHTIRNHLAQLMSKTGTNRQSELVRLLADLAAFGTGGEEETAASLDAPDPLPGVAGSRALRGFPNRSRATDRP